MMKVEKLICSYCKKEVPEQTSDMPTWFGRYPDGKLEMVICVDCLLNNKENWKKGVLK